VHLHLGDISEADADVAALLSPVDSKTGKSETVLTRLADETEITYANLLELEACIKIHLADTGPGRDVILAAGNIGESFTKAVANGRTYQSSSKWPHRYWALQERIRNIGLDHKNLISAFAAFNLVRTKHSCKTRSFAQSSRNE